eukprot:c17363_g1_i1.p1 GENE.c17363_g1_i1~~c17363_g1_i1.p1  ORF type:complete len:186 (-),score=68.21 c17363_g1_i1:50-607(-)
MEEDIGSLIRRVEALSIQIGGMSEAEKISRLDGGSLLQVFRKVRATFVKFGTQTQLAEFESRYSKIEPLLETNSLDLPSAAKVEIVLAAEAFLLDSADLLQKLNNLKNLGDQECVPDLRQKMKAIRPIQRVHMQQELETAHCQQRLNNLVDLYNSTLTRLSQQLYFWDAQLTQWETRVDKSLEQK